MGFLETKQKAAAFDKAQAEARQADLHNAGLAAYANGLKDAELKQLQRERVNKQMMQQALAAQAAYEAKYGKPQNTLESAPQGLSALVGTSR